jgi:hypothetical protein
MSRRGQLQPGRPFRHLLLSNLPVSCLESPPAKAGLLLEIETWGTRHPVKSFVSENPEEWRMRKPFVSVGKLGRIGCNLFSFMRLQQKWGRGGGASSFSCPFPRAAGSAWGIRSGGTDDFGLHSSIMRRWIEIICKVGSRSPQVFRRGGRDLGRPAPGAKIDPPLQGGAHSLRPYPGFRLAPPWAILMRPLRGAAARCIALLPSSRSWSRSL